MSKWYDFLWFLGFFSYKHIKYWILLKTGINTSKKVINKAAEATVRFLENRIARKVAKSYSNKVVRKNWWTISYSTRKKEKKCYYH